MAVKKKNKSFFSCLVNQYMRQGKKNFAITLLYGVGFFLGKKLNKNFFDLYNDIFNILAPSIELRKVRRRNTVYYVPFPSTIKRQQYLVSKWIFDLLRLDKKKKQSFLKLSSELIKILYLRSSLLKKKSDIYERADKSRSFSHYRWY